MMTKREIDKRLYWILGAFALLILGVSVEPSASIEPDKMVFATALDTRPAPEPLPEVPPLPVQATAEEIRVAALGGRPDVKQAKVYNDGVLVPPGAHMTPPDYWNGGCSGHGYQYGYGWRNGRWWPGKNVARIFRGVFRPFRIFRRR